MLSFSIEDLKHSFESVHVRRYIAVLFIKVSTAKLCSKSNAHSTCQIFWTPPSTQWQQFINSKNIYSKVSNEAPWSSVSIFQFLPLESKNGLKSNAKSRNQRSNTEIGCENVSCQKARSHEARVSGCWAELNVGRVGSLGGRQAKSGNRLKKKNKSQSKKYKKTRIRKLVYWRTGFKCCEVWWVDDQQVCWW